MKVKQFRGTIPFFLIIFISLWLFRGAFDINFFQDDYLFLLKAGINNFSNYLSFFIPQTNVQYYRPLTVENYYFFLHFLFGDNPFWFHLTGFIVFITTIILVYKICLNLFQNDKISYLFTFLWATSPIHYDSLYWIANFSYLSIIFIYLLAFKIYISKEGDRQKYWKIILFFILGLFFSEFIIGLPIILFSYSILQYLRTLTTQ